MRNEDVTLPYLLHQALAGGSPETVARRVRELYEYVGGFGVLLMLCYDWEGENGPRWKRLDGAAGARGDATVADLSGAEVVAASAGLNRRPGMATVANDDEPPKYQSGRVGGPGVFGILWEMARLDPTLLRATFDEVGSCTTGAAGLPRRGVRRPGRACWDRPGCRVLEIGCGRARPTRPLAERGCTIVAVEIGPHLAALARRKLARFRLSRW